MKIKEEQNYMTEIHFLKKFIFWQIRASFSVLITYQELAMTFLHINYGFSGNFH